MVIYNCDLCGKEVKKNKIYHRAKHRYCSHKCRYEAQKTTLLGSNNPNYRGRDKEKTCPNCGNEKDIRSDLCGKCFSPDIDIELLQTLVLSSISFLDTQKEYNKIKNTNVSRQKIISNIKKHKIDCSHFMIYKKVDGFLFTRKDLTKDSKVSRALVKGIIIREKLLDHTICSVCSTPNFWCNKKLTIQLDHIDGDHTNNEISNLRFLCPNCHSQTSTYCGRKRKHAKNLV